MHGKHRTRITLLWCLGFTAQLTGSLLNQWCWVQRNATCYQPYRPCLHWARTTGRNKTALALQRCSQKLAACRGTHSTCRVYGHAKGPGLLLASAACVSAV